MEDKTVQHTDIFSKALQQNMNISGFAKGSFFFGFYENFGAICDKIFPSHVRTN